MDIKDRIKPISNEDVISLRRDSLVSLRGFSVIFILASNITGDLYISYGMASTPNPKSLNAYQSIYQLLENRTHPGIAASIDKHGVGSIDILIVKK